MALAFAIAYFILFASYTTPPNSRDGQVGLPEFVRFYNSVLIAVGSALIATSVALWRLWPRRSKAL
jgi:hypothetical protein